MLVSGAEVDVVISARILAVSVPCLRWVLRVQHCWVLIVAVNPEGSYVAKECILDGWNDTDC